MTQKKSVKQGIDQSYWIYPTMNSAYDVGIYFGFTPQPHIPAEKADKDIAKHYVVSEAVDHSLFLVKPEEKSAMLRSLLQKNPALPVMTCSVREEKRKDHKKECAFDIIGTSKAVADATVIKTLYCIAEEEGFEDIVVEINSLGDKESFSRFIREFTSYTKKHLGDMSAEARQLFKKDALLVLQTTDEKSLEVLSHAPQPMNFLSEPSRAHFKEVLEFLETINISYVIKGHFVSNPLFFSHTIFSIVGKKSDKKDREIIATGGRWLGIAKKLGFKKDLPSVSGTILIEPSSKNTFKNKILKPTSYFIQMGHEAKFKSLELIDILRKAKIHIYHSLTKDKMTAQLINAEYLKVSHVLIMGQKESMENTILVRQMSNRCQDTIKLTNIAEHLKKVL